MFKKISYLCEHVLTHLENLDGERWSDELFCLSLGPPPLINDGGLENVNMFEFNRRESNRLGTIFPHI